MNLISGPRASKAGPLELKVLYFAVEKADYPRNVRIRNYLRDCGAGVTVVMRPKRRSKILEYLALLKLGLQHRRGYNIVILSEFSTNSFPISWLVSRLNGAVHAVDFFVGKYETLVEDRRTIGPKHVLARLLLFLDRSALRSADIAFADTAVRAQAFSDLVSGRSPVVNLPVGAPAWARMPGVASPRALDAPLDILYYGHYVPLHGVNVLLEGILTACQTVPIRATFVGDGTSKAHMMARVAAIGVEEHIDFLGYQPPTELRKRIASCDIVLGIFGESPKAGSVIANKVWQGLYAERIVVTRRSLALSEIEKIAGSRLIQVEPGNAGSISEALTRIYFSLAQEGKTPPPTMADLLEDYVVRQFDLAFSHPVLQNAGGYRTRARSS